MQPSVHFSSQGSSAGEQPFVIGCSWAAYQRGIQWGHVMDDGLHVQKVRRLPSRLLNVNLHRSQSELQWWLASARQTC